jgi:Holliday junction DNA helicase RuvA
MISRIQGLLTIKKPPMLEINVNGLHYEILAPMGTFYHLTQLNVPVSLYTHLVIREDAHQLYGFYEAHERDLFRALIKITGVGPKLALTILSGMSPEHFLECIASDDATQLTRIPGIGKKTAQRLLIDIKDRLKDVELPASVSSMPMHQTAPTPQSDALAALAALGYKTTEAKRALKAIKKEDADSETLIRDALQWLVAG